MPRVRILTDLTGEFNRVVMEYEVESVSEFESRMKDYTTDTVLREKMQGYTDLFQGGQREILQVM